MANQPATPEASPAVIVYVALLSTTAIVCGILAHGLEGDAQLWVGNAAWTIGALAACVGLGSAARRAPVGARGPWVLLLAAAVAWLAGQLIWDAYAAVSGLPPSPSPADIMWFAFAILCAVGILRLGGLTGFARRLAMLEALPLIVGGATLLLALLYDTARDAPLDELATATVLAYPVLYCAPPILMAQAGIARTLRVRRDLGLVLVFTGVLLEAVAFAFFGYDLLRVDYVPWSTPIDIMFVLGMVALGAGGLVARPTATTAVDQFEQERPMNGLLPTLMFWALMGTVVAFVLADASKGPRLLLNSGIFVVGTALAVRSALLVREQRRLRAEAIEASRVKSEFLASMSHEIRTPMNGVLGMIELLQGTPLDAEQRQFVARARESADSLLVVINDILDISKIEADSLELDDAPFDPRETIESVAELLAESAQRKNLELLCAVDASVPGQVRGDEGRLRQVLTNLVANAIKFTPEGEVGVSASAAAEPGGTTRLHVEVRDTGIGIDDGAAAKIFDAFTQADSSTSRQFGGTGLGLAISKRLVEAFGGELDFRSTPGEGTTFWFEVLLRDDSGERVASSPGTMAGRRMLVVDDNTTNLLIVAQQLATWGVTAETADSAEEGLELLRRAVDEGRPFEVAILDRAMPGMDGIDMAAAIRHDLELRDLPIIVLTSIGSTTTREDLGIEAWLTKPVRQSRLYDAVATAVGCALSGDGDAAARRGPLAAVPVSDSSPRVLVVDDNEVNRLVASELLRRRGLRVETAVDGHDAVEAARRETYAAIFMDCEMPGLNGFDATAAIRANEDDDARTPIVALTAHAMAGDRERCLAAGMDDYITKPMEPRSVDAVLRRWLPDPAAPALTPASGPTPSPAVVPETDDLVDVAHLEQLRTDLRDASIVDEVITLFIDSAQSQIDALAGAEGAELRSAAHALKGSSRSVGAVGLANLAEAIEQAAGAGDDATVRATLDRLPGTLARTTDRLRELMERP